ncbi:hypothetical protein Poli38472_005354 [Pythium oligandrum]|uniref:Cytochrome P450 n=1 Tax=Pythium oligandrum TaxID=41045 RepID=A0A8K1CFV4_PYTOL|nr:hypothetical protein Poli38472_005354 [Pythium oligandrum]|eukprot:TMW62736.1 hypothetical protein Poli38472_005354 [Pythium oligandrum]
MDCLEAEKEHSFQFAFDRAQRNLRERFTRPQWFWTLQRALGVGADGELKRDIAVIDDLVLGIITKSLHERENNSNRQGAVNIISLFLDHVDQTTDEDKDEYNPRYLRDVVVTFVIAERDTTAQAMSWFFLELSRHPEVVKKIRSEIQKELPELYEGKIAAPSMERVQQLTYLEAALKESLRLHPSVPFTLKTAARDVVLSDGSFIHKGWDIGILGYSMGRMTYIWGPDAEEYKPERWIDPETGKIIPISAFKFFSFNAGPRMCLGKNLALMEMKIVAASILSRFDIHVENERDVTYELSITLPMRGKMQVGVSQAADTLSPQAY